MQVLSARLSVLVEWLVLNLDPVSTSCETSAFCHWRIHHCLSHKPR
ncbi:hypothetical protein KC19_5G129000 [Ceratodon purpureus]|uniref:Uncharacterized protein n=1 Tax=Ceratodon purpureus TaxID=3225 RepID=A0A8T0I2B7_CERPU|nr:hypothetical protein KC19_5G129000 [Ceratodon purpureus]